MRGGGKRKPKLAAIQPVLDDKPGRVGDAPEDTPRTRTPGRGEVKANDVMPMSNMHQHVFSPINTDRIIKREIRKSIMSNARRAGYILLFSLSTTVSMSLAGAGLLYFLKFVNETCDSDAGGKLPAREFFIICSFVNFVAGLVQAPWSGGLCTKWLRYMGYAVFATGILARVCTGLAGAVMAGVAVGASSCSTTVYASLRNYTLLTWILNVASWGFPLFVIRPRSFAEGAEEAVGFGAYMGVLIVSSTLFAVGFSVVS